MVFTAFVGIGVYFFFLEYNLYNNSVYVEGTTTQYCYAGKNGKKGIEFTYQFRGKTYTNCNSYNPIDKILVPGGKFKVRVSEYEPSIGRMDFERPLNEESKLY